MRRRVSLAIALALTLTPSASPRAAGDVEQAFINRFAGLWQGAGTAEVPGLGEVPVDCQAEAQPGPNRIVFGGTCRTALIFSRDFSADIAYEPSTGVYAGTYVGARVGPANVSGHRFGDQVALTIDWPAPVNGAMQATMTIRNDGLGAFDITVTDAPEQSATPVTTLALALAPVGGTQHASAR